MCKGSEFERATAFSSAAVRLLGRMGMWVCIMVLIVVVEGREGIP